MEHEDGVLLDVSSAPEEGYRRIVEFAVSVQGLLWSSPLGGNEDSRTIRKKLVVIAPRKLDAVRAVVERNM